MMNRKFDRILLTEIKVGKFILTIADILFLLAVMILGTMIRFSLRHLVSGDWDGSMTEWMNAIHKSGGLSYMWGEHATDLAYNTPYMYLMCFVSYIKSDFSDMYWLKLASVVFDYLSAFSMFFIVYYTTQNKTKALLGFAAVIILPTVFINSAAWTQFDIIYSFFLLLSLYYALKEKSFLCLLFMGISFSIKLQAVFFLPFLILLWLKNKIRFRDFFLIPVVYFITVIPSWISGRSLIELLGVYIEEMNYYTDLTLNYPNFYIIFENNEFTVPLGDAGIALTIALLGCLAYYIYIKKFKLTSQIMITLCLFSTAITLYFLPYMHERYGLIVDLLAIAYGLTNLKRLPAAIGYCLVSLIAYAPYMFKSQMIPLYQVSLLFFILILTTGYDLYRQIEANLLPAADK